MATNISLSTGNTVSVWSGAEKSYSSDGLKCTVTVTANAKLLDGWVQSTGVICYITIDGVLNGPYTLLGNNDSKRTDAPYTGTKSISKTFSRGTTAKEIDWKVSYWQATGGYNGSGTGSRGSCKHVGTSSVSIAKLASWTVSYSANGGSGAPSSQTKWNGTNLKLSTTKPTRTGYSFLGWSTSSTATSPNSAYDPGDTYTANSALKLYAVWKANTYTIAYNANGGTGAPSSQTKTYGQTLTLSSTKPTRTNYDFKGWATSNSATTAAYQAGGSYTANSAATLYAVWELAYNPPSITGLSVSRCDSSGVETDSGTYANVSFSWTSEKAASKVAVDYRLTSSSSWSTAQEYSASGTSGTFNKVCCAGKLDPDSAYSIRVTVYDANGSASLAKTIVPMTYVLDILSGGSGAAFGKAASKEGVLELAWHLLIDATNSIKGEYEGTQYNQFQPINSNGNCVLGYGLWDAGIGGTNIYGNEVNVWSKESGLVGASIGLNKTLWSGALYMKSDQTITLSEAVSAQIHGIVLIWSGYSSGAATETNFTSFFIPKEYVKSFSGRGMYFDCSVGMSKYVYISDTSIAGNARNNASGTTSSGISYTNTAFVLRRVIGV